MGQPFSGQGVGLKVAPREFWSVSPQVEADDKRCRSGAFPGTGTV